MNQWIEQVNKRKTYLGNLITVLEKKLQGLPEGKLRISKYMYVRERILIYENAQGKIFGEIFMSHC